MVSEGVFVIAWLLLAFLHGCPSGYDLRTGIRVDGRYECWPHPDGDPDFDGTWQRPERGTQSMAILRGRILCPTTEDPVVLDDRRVGCLERSRLTYTFWDTN